MQVPTANRPRLLTPSCIKKIEGVVGKLDGELKDIASRVKLGDMSFISGAPTDHFATTLEDAEICALHHDDLREYLLRFPTVTYKMLETLSGRLERTEHQESNFAARTPNTALPPTCWSFPVSRAECRAECRAER